MFRYCRNPDITIRELERQLKAEPSENNAHMLLAGLQRLGEGISGQESLRFLRILNEWGDELPQYGRYVRGQRGYQKFIIPRLTPVQETRLATLTWQELLNSAAEIDKTSMRIDVSLLQRAVTFANREILNDWLLNLFVFTHGKHPKEYVLDHYDKDQPDEEYIASIRCKHHDDGIDLFETPQKMKSSYSAYWTSPQGQRTLEWHARRGEVPEYYTDDGIINGWLAGSSNAAALEFIYEHRWCINEPEDDYEPDMPDTPSLPPMGTMDPNW